MQTDRTKSLKLVLSMAERAESDAAAQFKQQRLQLKAQSQQLQQISDYQREYSNQINQLGVNNAQQMISQRNFLAQLEQLSQTQSETVEILKAQTEKAQEQWQLLYQKRKRLAELVEQLERDLDKQNEKRVQKELDEISRVMHSSTMRLEIRH